MFCAENVFLGGCHGGILCLGRNGRSGGEWDLRFFFLLVESLIGLLALLIFDISSACECF